MENRLPLADLGQILIGVGRVFPNSSKFDQVLSMFRRRQPMPSNAWPLGQSLASWSKFAECLLYLFTVGQHLAQAGQFGSKLGRLVSRRRCSTPFEPATVANNKVCDYDICCGAPEIWMCATISSQMCVAAFSHDGRMCHGIVLRFRIPQLAWSACRIA